jgi:hypothetical protein
VASAAVLALIGLVACDVGPKQLDAGRGPALHVLNMEPSDGQGIACDPAAPDCGVPVDTPIRLHVDRPVLPTTVVRQSIGLYTARPGLFSPFLLPEYDLLNRTITFRISGTLIPNLLYHLELPTADKPSDPGLRAFDGAVLEPGRVPSLLSFITSAASSLPAPRLTREPGCDEITQMFQSSCVSGCCHGEATPALGLRLDSADALVATAIARVAHETETGNTLGVAFVNPERFGVGQAIIEPGQPFASYLMYKLLVSNENLAPCTSDCEKYQEFEGPNACEPLSDDERGRMMGWFVQGEAMPMSVEAAHASGCTDLPTRPHLDCGRMRALSRFIATGAACL